MSTMSDDKLSHIAWLDLETTCLDENEPHAAVLEVGVYVTNYYLEPVASTSVVLNPGLEPRFLGYIDENDVGATREPSEVLDLIWQRMDSSIRGMHAKNDLWAEVVRSDWSCERADEALVAFLLQATESPQVALAGSGVSHFDSRWLKVFFPKTHKRLTYWSFDVGVMRRFLRDLCGVAVEEADPTGASSNDEGKAHRALADAKAHLQEARVYVDSLRGHTI
jgi:oligoribonuclease (3'-5' exoribonuclease)